MNNHSKQHNAFNNIEESVILQFAERLLEMSEVDLIEAFSTPDYYAALTELKKNIKIVIQRRQSSIHLLKKASARLVDMEKLDNLHNEAQDFA